MASPRFTEADVRRAAKGAIAAGLTVVRVEIDREGRVVVHTSGERDDRDLSPLELRRARRGED